MFGAKFHRKIPPQLWGRQVQVSSVAVPNLLLLARVFSTSYTTGKSSLLNILAGRARSNGRVKITSDVRLNNYPVDPTKIQVRQLIAFVAQDDSLQVTSTPREAIRFSAKLRLPRSISDHQIEKLTEKMLSELGLTACADTIVGGELIKGISGGERKRTSVGVELVTRPALVFLDEVSAIVVQLLVHNLNGRI